jgi:hypothetical protein
MGLLAAGAPLMGAAVELAACSRVWCAARNDLAAAYAELDSLNKALGSIAALDREDDHAGTYWDPVMKILARSGTTLIMLGSRMTGVHNVATICGLAQQRDADACLLLCEGERIRALAMRTLGPQYQEVHEITVDPRALQAGERGLGGTLMEYLVREAATAHSDAGVPIRLYPVDGVATTIYSAMGFTAAGDYWVMRQQAQQDYLRKRAKSAASAS